MYLNRSGICPAVLFLLLLFVIPASAQAPQPAGRNVPFPAFQLPAPQNELEAAYLGVPESGTFSVGQIRAQIVLIEILSAYCPYCQRVAPLVDDVYQRIQKDPALKGKIKMIGIGMTNTPYELDTFKKKFNVPFPLFADPGGEISKKFNVPGTPTFIGVKVDGKGGAQEVFYRPGAFRDADQFMAELTKATGLK
jgi:peroxiredoxin